MATKHEQILDYIRQLDVGSKISVRGIAKELQVSEGTAYRAIKDAEAQGLVSTIGRVGTIRIEKKEHEHIEKLTFAEVVKVVEGTVIGGRAGLHKTLNKFVIGAMRLEDMMRYVENGNLLIVGNRVKAHRYALEAGAAVLITGGFDTTDDAKRLADELELPIISTAYDTFTVATMINRAIYDRLIKKEIMLVEDILIPAEKTYFLRPDQQVSDWHDLSRQTGHSRFPVVKENGEVCGVVTAKDIIGRDVDLTIGEVMTHQPLTSSPKMSVASAAHMMIWEGIELLPVVDERQILLGIISRQDVLKAMQYIQKQPQVGETFDDLITTPLDEVEEGENFYLQIEITPQMTNHLGMLSTGVLTTLMLNAGERLLRRYKKGDLVADTLNLYFLKPVQIEQKIQIHPRLFELGRKFGKVEIDVLHQGKLVAKGIMSAQLIDRS
ncbi:putative signal transduction protein with CBS and DRTGG domains [Caldalkalibacillus thermarum TA2.A1]|uniref:CBS domain-containing protein n=1 Tax=Caldalkalibacillus thermarum (strain TA2.A1) TaxID=986075 RepID=F5L6G4_CALTT|nr:DRTGG domain-containing protein [Caldalkalibacillus thermarum]EGL83074.1 putative signal transduction protein with CBS and DRTGG domains [Caldalkalibacillus thermarum TA2.A1]QZT34910.1 CBS domain-containing protein [Caldalkalibacillus thermarum TA2.A1]